MDGLVTGECLGAVPNTRTLVSLGAVGSFCDDRLYLNHGLRGLLYCLGNISQYECNTVQGNHKK